MRERLREARLRALSRIASTPAFAHPRQLRVHHPREVLHSYTDTQSALLNLRHPSHGSGQYIARETTRLLEQRRERGVAHPLLPDPRARGGPRQ